MWLFYAVFIKNKANIAKYKNDYVFKRIFIRADSIVNDIIAHDDYTEVVMKIDGNYNYKLLSNIVLFDEDMNDTCAFEGAMTTLNDIEEKIVTVKLTKIDLSKKYTIAIPVTTDLVIDESEKATISLK